MHDSRNASMRINTSKQHYILYIICKPSYNFITKPVFAYQQSVNYYCRTYTFNDRRYGQYQPNGYGQQYPGQKTPGQYPQGFPAGEDRFKFDPVRNANKNFLYRFLISFFCFYAEQSTKCSNTISGSTWWMA